MLYRTNVGGRESVARMLGGALIIAVSLTEIGMTPLGGGLAAGGALAALTGVLGFCPACAMLGRRPLEGPQ